MIKWKTNTLVKRFIPIKLSGINVKILKVH